MAQREADRTSGCRIGFGAAAALLPTAEGERVATLFASGSLEVMLYAPRGEDPQAAHRRDEIYVVASGEGSFVCGTRRERFGPLDVLFVPAGVVHRFEDFSADFQAWVFFYGPDGGEGGKA
jgi:mannose-6-phosphate isomerase-like protein (cupin superfamily)